MGTDFSFTRTKILYVQNFPRKNVPQQQDKPLVFLYWVCKAQSLEIRFLFFADFQKTTQHILTDTMRCRAEKRLTEIHVEKIWNVKK